jgi:MarR family transcriptional regulator for hemolysin
MYGIQCVINPSYIYTLFRYDLILTLLGVMPTKSQLQQAITTDILLSGRRWRKAAGRVLAAHGISEATAAPLICIARLGNGVRQTDIACQIGIESASLVRLINQLEAQKLVIRQSNDCDLRANGLWLTEEGEAIAQQMEELLTELRRSVFARFSKSDLEIASRVLNAFAKLE